MAVCIALYEPNPPGYRWSDANWKKGTHTCSLAAGHAGPHICPRCDKHWDTPVGAQEAETEK